MELNRIDELTQSDRHGSRACWRVDLEVGWQEEKIILKLFIIDHLSYNLVLRVSVGPLHNTQNAQILVAFGVSDWCCGIMEGDKLPEASAFPRTLAASHR